jgi:hypothetical protein
MPFTKDIGGGIQMLDAQALERDAVGDLTKQLTLVDLANKIGNAPLERKKLETQILKDQQDAQEQQTRLAAQGLTAVLSGDLTTANRINQQYRNPNETLSMHPDPQKRALGYIMATDNTTGGSYELDPQGDLRAKTMIGLRADLIKQAAQHNLTNASQREQFIRDNAKAYAEAGFGTPAQGAAFAKWAVDAAQSKYDSSGQPLASAPLAEIDNHLRAGAELQTARVAGFDPNQPLRKMTQLPEKIVSDLTNNYKSSKELAAVLDKAQQLSSNLVDRPGLLSMPLRKARGLINQNDPQFTALQTLMTGANFETVLKYMGTTFTEGAMDRMKPIIPNENDSIGQIMAKTAAMMAVNATAATTTLETAEAVGHDTGGMRRLLQGPKVDVRTDGATAQMILNSIPESIRGNPAMFNKFMGNLGPQMQKSLDAELARIGAPRAAGIANDARSILRR